MPLLKSLAQLALKLHNLLGLMVTVGMCRRRRRRRRLRHSAQIFLLGSQTYQIYS